jgi:hypothetical protein
LRSWKKKLQAIVPKKSQKQKKIFQKKKGKKSEIRNQFKELVKMLEEWLEREKQKEKQKAIEEKRKRIN